MFVTAPPVRVLFLFNDIGTTTNSIPMAGIDNVLSSRPRKPLDMWSSGSFQREAEH